jgi:magnesium transporter
LHDCVTELEFPKIDDEDSYLFIVIHIPWLDTTEHLYHAAEVDIFEDNLFNNDTPHILREIAEVRRDVIALRHILRPQLEIMRHLEKGNWPFIQGKLDPYWGDIGDQVAQLQARLEEHNEVLSSLSDTIDTLASHRIDEVVRLLTVVTLLTVPLTVLSTIFGMNVQLPYGGHPLPFYLINVIGVVTTALVIWYLRYRRWL